MSGLWIFVLVVLAVWAALHTKTTRSDGVPVPNLHPYRKLMPYVMTTRNTAVVYFDDYVARQRPLPLIGGAGDRVAVITAQGSIQGPQARAILTEIAQALRGGGTPKPPPPPSPPPTKRRPSSAACAVAATVATTLRTTVRSSRTPARGTSTSMGSRRSRIQKLSGPGADSSGRSDDRSPKLASAVTSACHWRPGSIA